MNQQSYVYIMGNSPRGVLYIGVTSNLVQRVYQHKNKTFQGFTEKYNCNKLYFYEVYEDISEAILREKRLKKWKRDWKFRIIEEVNFKWKDLYEEIRESYL